MQTESRAQADLHMGAWDTRPALKCCANISRERDYPITAIRKDAKALRGTKRVCQACDVPFYDLSRDPIVCPSCGAHYQLAVVPAPVEARGARFGDKSGWRDRSFKPPEAESHGDAATEDAPIEEPTEEQLGPAAHDDVVLDEEGDEADLSGLLDHRDEEGKER